MPPQASGGAPTAPETVELLKKALAKSPLFASLADRDPLALINKVVGMLRCRRVAEGEVVIEQGTTGRSRPGCDRTPTIAPQWAWSIV